MKRHIYSKHFVLVILLASFVANTFAAVITPEASGYRKTGATGIGLATPGGLGIVPASPRGIAIPSAASSDAKLSGLVISNGTLSPAFAAATNSYFTFVPNAVTTIKVTPTTNDASATVTVNNTPVTSGTASSNITLALGFNFITTVVTASDGTTTNTYTITLFRELSTDAKLSNLTISSGTLAPTFASGTTSYAATVSGATASVTVTPTTHDANATVTVNGNAVSSGTASASIPLNPGANTISTLVTAQDGSTIDTYTITVTRFISSDATLSALSISSGTLTPVFASGTTSYSASVISTTASIMVTPATNNAGATVKVNGATVTSGTASASLPLSFGPNTITTIVTAQDGATTKTYTIVVTRLSSIATLANLTISSGVLTPAFRTGHSNYSVSVTNGVTSITLTPTASDASSNIKIKGATVTSGTASASIALSQGSNSIPVTVTSPDGTATKTYNIVVTRHVLSQNATLKSLAINIGTLTPAFAPGINYYKDTVSNATASVNVTATTGNVNATVKVNGTTVASGSQSPAIPLSTGDNIIHITVTAQDQTTIRTYTIKVTRRSLSANATLANLTLSSGTLTPVFAASITSYKASVSNATATVQLTPTTNNANASIKVMGTPVTSGTASGDIALSVGPNVITTVVTAQNGTTTKTYTITVTRAASGGLADNQLTASTAGSLADDGVVVHQGVSPNGDGMSDFLTIDRITAYPDNKLTIMSRHGDLVFETRGYDNTSKKFDGHSNKNGKKQQPGTYFYALEYKAGGVSKHKTGFIILKY